MTRYTRRFWYEVRCALLVLRGAPYRRRYGARANRQHGGRLLFSESSLAATESSLLGDISERFPV